MEAQKRLVLNPFPKFARFIQNPTVVDPALVCRIRLQDNFTGICRPGYGERRTAFGRLQVGQTLLDGNFHMGAASLEVEHLNERVLAAFRDHAKYVLPVI